MSPVESDLVFAWRNIHDLPYTGSRSNLQFPLSSDNFCKTGSSLHTERCATVSMATGQPFWNKIATASWDGEERRSSARGREHQGRAKSFHVRSKAELHLASSLLLSLSLQTALSTSDFNSSLGFPHLDRHRIRNRIGEVPGLKRTPPPTHHGCRRGKG